MSTLEIRTNVPGLSAHRNMRHAGMEQGKAAKRLTSGYRINNAADDPAGLAISESMRSQIRGLDQAYRNCNDGIALIQTAEGGLQEICNMLHRLRELIVQAANDTTTPGRHHIQGEIDNIMEEIDTLASRVQFNGRELLSGNYAGRPSVLSGLSEHQMTMGLITHLNATLNEINQPVGFSTPQEAVGMQSGPFQGPLFFQVGANSDTGFILYIERVDTHGLGLRNPTISVVEYQFINQDGDIETAPTTSGSQIHMLLDRIDTALERALEERSHLGAAQSRLEYAMQSLSVTSENLSDAESRVRNADMAREMMDYMQMNVLFSAASALLAQAKQTPNMVLQLLQG